jgi:hypothetical protein
MRRFRSATHSLQLEKKVTDTRAEGEQVLGVIIKRKLNALVYEA